MSEVELQSFSRGAQADYVFGTLEGWDGFNVVHWRAIEEISQPFQFEITAIRTAAQGEADLASLLETGATFRIATEGRFRPVHGLIAEAEELDRTTEMFAYRFLLVPHLWVLRYRTACRTFRRKNIANIINMVLENQVPGSPTEGRSLRRNDRDLSPSSPHPSFDVEFEEPTAFFRLSLDEPERIFDDERRTHVVQYNESDLAFLSRVFEEEGLSYFFEHGDDAVMMTITDRVGHDPLFARDEKHTLRSATRGGSTRNQEVIRTLRTPQRMRSRSAVVVDHSERTPLGEVRGEISAGIATPKRMQHYEFPGVFEGDSMERALPVATHRLERFDAERHFSEGTSTVRTLEPGRRCVISDGDGLRPDREVTIVRVETEARQLATTFGEEAEHDGATERDPFYRNKFTVLPTKLRFRPAPLTPKPRIHGLHQAIVTAEEFPEDARPEINANDMGAVRIRFPWDSRPPEDGIPSSRAVSVSQYWAGVGYGALHTPRVGHFVLAAFQDGDPDRPVVVGRLYSEQMPPPYDPSKEPTRTTWKSKSSPKAEGSNELRFEDKAKQEEIFLHAQRDLNEVVLASHSTSVGGDQSNSVGGNRSHDVKGTETVTITGDRTTNFLSNEFHTVSGFQTVEIGANERHATYGFRSSEVGANDDLGVWGWRNTHVGAGDTLGVGGKRDITVGADQTTWSANTYFFPSGTFGVGSTTADFNQSASFHVKAGGCELSMSAGVVSISNGAGAAITLLGGNILINAGAAILETAGGPIVNSAGGPLNLTAGGNINALAPLIKLNG